MNKPLPICLTALLVTICMAANCSTAPPKYHPGGPYYYKSWASYLLPYRPVDEVTKSEAEELERQGYAYYIAFFNEQGLIKSFEKRYQGKMELKATFFYENGLLIKEESLDANGKMKHILFDKNGEIIKP